MKPSETCHICGETSTRTHRGYPLCDHCEGLLDEILALTEDEYLWQFSPIELSMMDAREG